MDKGRRTEDHANHFPLGCATLSVFTGRRGGDWNAYIAYTLGCGGHPIYKSVFYPFQTSLVPIRWQRRDERRGWPARETRTTWVGKITHAPKHFEIFPLFLPKFSRFIRLIYVD